MAKGAFPKQKFYEHQRMNPYWSDFVCFVETIKGKKDISSRVLKRYFEKLVDKDDYAKEDRGQIIKFLLDVRRTENTAHLP